MELGLIRNVERLIILDRDGTLIRHVNHIVDPDLVELIAGAGEALASLAESGFEFAIVTNQSVIGRGMTTRANVDKINYFWLAAPLAGLVVQPIIGLSSDKTWTRLGRRIPFILLGSIISALAMFFMPNSLA